VAICMLIFISLLIVPYLRYNTQNEDER
jgi:hypothetical protein